ncbi:FAD-dependent oxidoreductase [Trebonia kvetii]|uniref:FAD-dependent oxidoreductase n=1 Tax=Trebonia kvetii TaxID=2480626 RepID=A0A6P2BL03_9ACTN|nr:FAD-dependent oxidoreductase [Trebonia kvetii]TVY99106.1 FAD-dependent oxidoreductase [Trebonia kvetii]
MPHELTELRLDAVTRPATWPVHEITADVCVVGAGIAGSSAAIESARLGRSVVLVDSLPLIGGQMVHSLIGLFAGIFGNAPRYPQLTHGIFDDIFAALEPAGDLYFSRGHTTTVFYNEVALGRWLERTVRDLGIQVITGAVLGDVDLRDGFVSSVELATRYGDVRVRAAGYVDASGDAALTYRAGLPCWEPSRPIYGSQQVIVENLNEAHKPDNGEIDAVFAARGEEFGLLRRGGLAFFFPGRGTAVLNVTHIDAPLDPAGASRAMFQGRDQADGALALLKAEFPKAFGEARVRAYGFPGRRQTRWIRGAHQLTVDEVRAGTVFDDAVARTAWPVELHDRSDGYVWEMFPAEHVHYVPLRSMLPPGAANLVAAGRCVDGDAAALSSVRVMGPCSAMGFAAAHVLAMASGGNTNPFGMIDFGSLSSVHDTDLERLRSRIGANIGADIGTGAAAGGA